MCQICRDSIKILQSERVITKAQAEDAWNKALEQTSDNVIMSMLAEAFAKDFADNFFKPKHKDINMDSIPITKVKQ